MTTTPTAAAGNMMFGKKRLRSWRCPYCVEDFAKDKIPRRCVFDSRDKSFCGDNWNCGSVKRLRYLMRKVGVRLIDEEREVKMTTRWASINGTQRFIFVWKRGHPWAISMMVAHEYGVRPATWDDFVQLAADAKLDEADDQTIKADTWSREGA